jgi:hypothetical protein
MRCAVGATAPYTESSGPMIGEPFGGDDGAGVAVGAVLGALVGLVT